MGNPGSDTMSQNSKVFVSDFYHLCCGLDKFVGCLVVPLWQSCQKIDTSSEQGIHLKLGLSPTKDQGR